MKNLRALKDRRKALEVRQRLLDKKWDSLWASMEEVERELVTGEQELLAMNEVLAFLG